MRVTQPAASPRRVLLVADCVGGVWQYSLELAGGLSDGGVEVVLAVAGPPPSAAQRAQAEAICGLRIAILDVGLDWLADGERELAPLRERLLALAEREEVDLVHLNGAGLGDLPTDRPVIATQHSCLATWWQAMRPDEPLPAAWRWHRARMASGLRAAAAVIAPSAAFAAQIRRAYGADLELEVVRNGRSQHRFRPAARRQAVVITAGRLWDEAKNVRTLDAAAAGVAWPVLAAGPTAGPDGQRVGLANAFALGAIDAAEMRRRLARAGVFVSLAALRAVRPRGARGRALGLRAGAERHTDLPRALGRAWRCSWHPMIRRRRARRSTGSSPTVACGRRSPSGRAAGR